MAVGRILMFVMIIMLVSKAFRFFAAFPHHRLLKGAAFFLT